MGTLGPNSGGTFADDGTVGSISITNAANAGLSDNSYATVVMLVTQVGHYLKVTNFGFTIPLDATITGVTVGIERSTTLTDSVVDNSVKLVKGGTISGDEKAAGTNWPTSDTYATYGSATDLWGLTLTPVDINLSTFGVAVSPTASLLGATAQIDHIRITVDYTGSNRSGSDIRHVSTGNGMSRNDVSS